MDKYFKINTVAMTLVDKFSSSLEMATRQAKECYGSSFIDIEEVSKEEAEAIWSVNRDLYSA